MFNRSEIIETISMIEQENLDIRTITMGISLRDCAAERSAVSRQRIYDKITRLADKLVRTGEDIEREFGIPIINKRISVTPVAMVAESSDETNYARFAETLDAAAKAVGVNFIGGFSALVHKATPRETIGWCRPLPRLWPAPTASAPRSTWPPPRPASTWTRCVRWAW